MLRGIQPPRNSLMALAENSASSMEPSPAAKSTSCHFFQWRTVAAYQVNSEVVIRNVPVTARP